jgi:hypothetical protein
MDLWAAVPAEVEGSCDLQYSRAETLGPVFALILTLHPQANILEVTMAGVCSLVHTFALCLRICERNRIGEQGLMPW